MNLSYNVWDKSTKKKFCHWIGLKKQKQILSQNKMAITIAIPCQPNFWQYRISVYWKFGTVMVINFTKPKVRYRGFWYGNRTEPTPIHKTTFRCLGNVGAYEYVVMPFGLKNASAPYQRAMNAIFHDLIGHSMEVYINDIVVKSKTEEQHLVDHRHTLTRMRTHKLKMNPKKCAFGVRSDTFLGFLVHQKWVEVDKNKARVESPPPPNKIQLQRLLGKINCLRRFIANLAGKIHLLTLHKEDFEWGSPHQEAFDKIKAYLASPPVLMPPQRGKPLKLYISASEKSLGSLWAQNNEGRKEQAIPH